MVLWLNRFPKDSNRLEKVDYHRSVELNSFKIDKTYRTGLCFLIIYKS
ncbi:hypothetical protein C8J23_10835 [Shewanella chilikensis]|uniref:Uncharacterized protein n=1 Tax=Shewanella chilikensis TaxID=558541 RepID=A0ABX5PQ26_9GAMM|nr:hypothetical protein C8J23_10835 [Shewanella chilikensis]